MFLVKAEPLSYTQAFGSFLLLSLYTYTFLLYLAGRQSRQALF